MDDSADFARNILIAAGMAGAGMLASKLRRNRQELDLEGQVVFITGGSRGLGLLMAREFARQGCRIAICARDPEELERARMDIEQFRPGVLALPCNVADQSQVNSTVETVIRHFGQIDVLVNNAGIIVVGPVQTMTRQDFENTMNVTFWGPVWTTFAALPHMVRRQRGRLVNITSIGGKVSVPHLIPYCCAKFAVMAFSEGLRAELAKEHIGVTTVVPGLMRTGSHVNALFKGQQESEFTWFTLSATSPLVSIDAERAAREIVRAVRAGDAEAILGAPAKLLAKFQGLFPGVTSELMGLVNEFVLPALKGRGLEAVPGAELRPQVKSMLLEILTRIGQSRSRRNADVSEAAKGSARGEAVSSNAAQA